MRRIKGSVQSLSHVRLFATPWIAARQASLSITNSRSSLRLRSIESAMPSSHLLLPPILPNIRVFSNKSTLRMRWPKYWSFSFSIIPSKEHPGLISFRMDWLDLLAVQGTLKSFLQYHSSKASSILQRSAFFTVQLSHPYMTTRKIIWYVFEEKSFILYELYLKLCGIFGTLCINIRVRHIHETLGPVLNVCYYAYWHVWNTVFGVAYCECYYVDDTLVRYHTYWSLVHGLPWWYMFEELRLVVLDVCATVFRVTCQELMFV